MEMENYHGPKKNKGGSKKRSMKGGFVGSPENVTSFVKDLINSINYYKKDEG